MQKKFLRITTKFLWLFPLLMLALSCKRVELETATSSDVNIVGYLEQHPEQFSSLVSILERTNTYGYLNAYGIYTFFAPTNDAISSYLQHINKSSLNDVDVATLQDFVKIHLIRDTISTSQFTDGKLPVVTEYGQYLITGVSSQSGTARYTINRNATVIQTNVRTGNGIVHVLDRVLQPASLTVAQTLEADGRYTIFTKLLKETGYFDTVNRPLDADSAWYTVLAQSDSIYQRLGLSSYEALAAKYSDTGNPKLSTDSLHLYAAYHIIDDLRFLADIVSTQTHRTLAPLEVLTSKLNGTTILINEDEFNGEIEPGIELNRSYSDVQASNGAIHDALGDIVIKVRQPFAVYWDVTDQPELRRLTSVFRRGRGESVEFSDPTVFSGVTWQGGSINYTTVVSTAAETYSYDDYFSMFLRTGAHTQWIEFDTPLLVQGRYKVWVGFRRARAQTIQVLFNDALLSSPRLIDVSKYYDYTDENVAESEGYKRYAAVTESTTSTIRRSMIGRLVGIVDVETTGQHKLKFVSLTNESGTSNTFNLDMVHFIPVDQDQQWPRFRRDGSAQYATDAP